MNLTPYCDDETANYYQQQIGVLRWIVELGHMDVCTEVSMLASYTMAPCEGHMQVMFHMFAFLNTHQNQHWYWIQVVSITELKMPQTGDHFTQMQERKYHLIHLHHWVMLYKLHPSLILIMLGIY